MIEKTLLAIFAIALFLGLMYTKKLVDVTSRNVIDSGSNPVSWK
jgi:hypothetical protein